MASIARLAAIFACIWMPSLAAAQTPSCKVEQVAVLSLGYSGGFPSVTAKINGVDVTMGIDSGAQTLVTPETAARFNLRRDRHSTIAIGTTAITFVDNVLLRNFEFAGKRYGAKSVASISLGVVPPLSAGVKARPAPSPVAGIIGADLLSEYDIDFDLAGKTMTLYKVKGCKSVTPPWTESYTPLAIKVTAKNMIAMPVEIDGHKLSGLLDTGSTGFAISKRGALRSGVTEAMLRADPVSQIIGAGAVVSKQPTHRFKTVIVGGETFRDLSVGLIGIERSGPEILVGQTYLLFRRVWISYSTRMLYIRAPRMPFALQLPQMAANPLQPQIVPGGKPDQTLPQAYTADPNNNCLSFDAMRTCGLPPLARAALPPTSPPPLSAPISPPQPFKPQFGTLKNKPAGFIGMKFVALSQPAIRALGLSEENVLMVHAPVPGGPADRAGLRAGDFILSYDGVPIFGATSFEDAIKVKGEGHALELSFLRGTGRLTAIVTLAGMEEKKRVRERFEEAANRSERLEQIIGEETAISERFRAPGFQYDWAYSQIRLGDALRERIQGGQAGNLNQAIAAYLGALHNITPQIQLLQWAAAHHGLGVAYRKRDGGAQGEDLERSVVELEEAFAIRVKHGLNIELAATSLELGIVYAGRKNGTQADNLEKALSHLKKAAEYYDPASNPKPVRLLNQTLSAVYLKRAGVSRSAQVDSAIEALQKALDVTDQAKSQDEFADIANGLEALKAEKLRLAAAP